MSVGTAVTGGGVFVTVGGADLLGGADTRGLLGVCTYTVVVLPGVVTVRVGPGVVTVTVLPGVVTVVDRDGWVSVRVVLVVTVLTVVVVCPQLSLHGGLWPQSCLCESHLGGGPQWLPVQWLQSLLHGGG